MSLASTSSINRPQLKENRWRFNPTFILQSPDRVIHQLTALLESNPRHFLGAPSQDQRDNRNIKSELISKC